VLEGILYFALGFFTAALLALMISPALWNRAVTLTRKRVESSVPLTLNEVRADKDQLRAEFAMSTRRLEMSVEELRERASRQVIDISRKRDELAKLMEESRDRIRTIEELEIRSSDLRARLKEREEKLVVANRQLNETTSRLESTAHQLETLRAEIGEIQSDADSNRIELVVKQTEMENLRDRVSDATQREQALKDEVEKLRNEAAGLDAERQKHGREKVELKERATRLHKQLADSQQMVDQRELELARLRQFVATEEQVKNDLANQLTKEKAQNIELEARMAQSALKMEALLNDASNDNVEKAMASLNQDRERLESQLLAIREERDQLKSDLSGRDRRHSEDWEVERRENAILRERINDLAAQVTAMTAALEGSGSVIDELLANDPKPIHIAGKTYAAKPNEDVVAATSGHRSLADRIRALQETARQNKAG
jgi:chromosome segregation ATPase